MDGIKPWFNKSLLYFLLIIIVYLIFVFLKHPGTTSYQFNQGLISDYLRSQDIEDIEDKIKDRIHISDSDIYISAGYLYAKGEVPTKYNFQHAPLIKYLLGFSTIIFNNPFIVQIIFGCILLLLTYILGLKIFKNAFIGILASGFLLFDPLFSDLISGGLLDLGQAVFSTSYVLGSLLVPSNFVLNGILLGLVGASKSWTTSIFLLVALSFYRIVCRKEKTAFKNLLLTIIVAAMAFSLTYLKAFIEAGGHFNIVYWQLRILKFLISHDSAAFIGGNVILFLTGYFKEWWQQSEFVRSQIWSPLWPMAFLSAVFGLIKEKKDSLRYFLYFLPILYLLYISTGVPFSRYFILVLPYLYLSLSKMLFDIAKKVNLSGR